MGVRRDKGNRGHWQVDFQHHGRRYRRYSLLNTREGALELESRMRRTIANGDDCDALFDGQDKRQVSEQSFEQFSKTWLDTYVETNNKPSSRRSKRNAIDNHLGPFFGKKLLRTISVMDIEEFKTKKVASRLSPKTINNLLSVFRKCLTCAEEWGLIQTTPKVKWLRVPPPTCKYLSVDESTRLLMGAESPYWFAFILCALRTGMRIGEICALEWSDINWDQHTIHVRRSVVEGIMDSPKNNRTRIIPLADDLYGLFLKWGKQSGLIFPGPDGSHMRKSSWPWKALYRACKRAGLPKCGWHTLRHTFASQLTAKAVPMKAIQMLLGHSTIQMTERYAHLAPSVLGDAVAVLPQAGMYQEATRTE